MPGDDRSCDLSGCERGAAKARRQFRLTRPESNVRGRPDGAIRDPGIGRGTEPELGLVLWIVRDGAMSDPTGTPKKFGIVPR
jgi:hypothetical protein